MHLGLGISQSQVQKLMMTNELKMAIKILQMSALELVEYVEEQLVENPVLEKSDYGLEENKGDSFEQGEYEHLITQAPTLHEHLLFQLSLSGLSDREKKIAEFLIGNIDDNGYIDCSVEEAASYCLAPMDDVNKVLKVIQGFEPAGVGARDLKECLLIQYEQLKIDYPLLKEIISFHIQEIADGKIMKVAKKLGVSLKEIQDAVDSLRLFEPKPGRKFSRNIVRYIVPDVIVEKTAGEYIVLVNDVMTPVLFISPLYKEILRDFQGDSDSRKYIETKLKAALWIIKSIEQRRLTLYKVARCLVDLQRDFFDKGINHLKPLNLKRVAKEIGVHESTVSRATANKYMQTPRGLFEMKYLFSAGISNCNGSYTSAESVKYIIRELVEKESSKKPLSDQKITEILNEQGINISRRTVAKYRDEMGILPAVHRKRF